VLPWPIHRLSTLRVGVVGLGRIGSTFARSIKPFVRDVVGFDPFLAASQLEAKNVTPTSLESLFETSDIISLHLPLSEKTRHLVSTRTIALMKRKPIIINVQRALFSLYLPWIKMYRVWGRSLGRGFLLRF
jgi:D-3-phosphoglycerate dehydrogenase / 2-oxoglutarate reductase